jgi:hypothetical protein
MLCWRPTSKAPSPRQRDPAAFDPNTAILEIGTKSSVLRYLLLGAGAFNAAKRRGSAYPEQDPFFCIARMQHLAPPESRSEGKLTDSSSCIPSNHSPLDDDKNDLLLCEPTPWQALAKRKPFPAVFRKFLDCDTVAKLNAVIVENPKQHGIRYVRQEMVNIPVIVVVGGDGARD